MNEWESWDFNSNSVALKTDLLIRIGYVDPEERCLFGEETAPTPNGPGAVTSGVFKGPRPLARRQTSTLPYTITSMRSTDLKGSDHPISGGIQKLGDDHA